MKFMAHAAGVQEWPGRRCAHVYSLSHQPSPCPPDLQGYSTYVSDLVLYSQESLNNLRQDQAKLSNPVSVEVLPELQHELEQLLKMWEQSEAQVQALQAKQKQRKQEEGEEEQERARSAAAASGSAADAALQAECE